MFVLEISYTYKSWWENLEAFQENFEDDEEKDTLGLFNCFHLPFSAFHSLLLFELVEEGTTKLEFVLCRVISRQLILVLNSIRGIYSQVDVLNLMEN